MNRKLREGDDGLIYDENVHFVYTGLSPLSEEKDAAEPDDEPEDDA